MSDAETQGAILKRLRGERSIESVGEEIAAKEPGLDIGLLAGFEADRLAMPEDYQKVLREVLGFGIKDAVKLRLAADRLEEALAQNKVDASNIAEGGTSDLVEVKPSGRHREGPTMKEQLLARRAAEAAATNGVAETTEVPAAETAPTNGAAPAGQAVDTSTITAATEALKNLTRVVPQTAAERKKRAELAGGSGHMTMADLAQRLKAEKSPITQTDLRNMERGKQRIAPEDAEDIIAAAAQSVPGSEKKQFDTLAKQFSEAVEASQDAWNAKEAEKEARTAHLRGVKEAHKRPGIMGKIGGLLGGGKNNPSR